MVEMTGVSDTYANLALNIGIILLVVLIIGGIAALTFWLAIRYKRYNQFVCVVWGKDGFGQITQRYDKAGIFVDSKTGNKRFFLKSANVGLEPDNVPYVMSNGKKMVYLLQTGLKNFRFIKPVIAEGVMTFDVGEEDVNWAVNSYERQKTNFASSLLLQYLPFIVLAFVCVIILVIFIYFFKQFPVLKEVAAALKEAAVALAQAKGGTVVLPS